MGDKNILGQADEARMRRFTSAVLNDLHALEFMLDGGQLETGPMRIGAEQEMFLIDAAMRPSPSINEVLSRAKDGRLTTEIAKFNIEANLTPLEFTGDCLTRLETELNEIYAIVETAASAVGAAPVLCGILPTIQMSDLVEENLTDSPRYHELNRALTELHGPVRHIGIKGVDELRLQLDDSFSEFSNTSFQVHLQVDIRDFVTYYNWAQAIAGPVLAVAANSPLLLGHRLWHETRIALFQHSVDERSRSQLERNRTPRVTFGRDWVHNTMLEIFHEDLARFRIIFTREIEENSIDVLRAGGIPALDAWRLHNGTIWRWNRACYGIISGRPSLRIEARFLPSGPTIADEMANAAFFLGLMIGAPAELGKIDMLIPFETAKQNFFNAARFGLQSQLGWIDCKSHAADKLILEELIPLARRGLALVGVDESDADRFLSILEERVGKQLTGSKWMLDSLAAMDPAAKPNVRMRSLTAAMKRNQTEGTLLKDWPLADIPSTTDWLDNYKTVEQFMVTDLFTVRPEDVVDLAVNLMQWRHIRHIPVEDSSGRLVGVVSYRDMLGILADGRDAGTAVVRDIMKTDPVTILPGTPTLEALSLMRTKGIGCLPVVKGDQLVGLITAYDFLTVSSKLLEERLRSISVADGDVTMPAPAPAEALASIEDMSSAEVPADLI